MNDIFKTENLIELHENLNEFALHHQNLGGQKAHKIIKEMWDKERESLRDGSELGKARDEGYDKAIRVVLSILHKAFVP